MEDFVLNDKLFDYVISTIRMMIESTIEENSSKMTTFISVNNLLNELDGDFDDKSIDDIFYEEITDKLFAEIKNCL